MAGIDDHGGYALPADATLAEFASALNEAGHWAEVADTQWRTVFVTESLQVARGLLVEAAPSFAGAFMFGTEYLEGYSALPTGSIAVESSRRHLAHLGAWVVEDLGGDREALRTLVDDRLVDVLDEIPSNDGRSDAPSALAYASAGYGVGASRPIIVVTAARVRRPTGELAGTLMIHKPELDMTVLAALGAMGDRGHFERMQSVAGAGRRPGAILFADLEGSTPLAKRLSTANYFTIGRRMTRAADQCIVDAGGIAGRHSGDGVVAFFLTEHLGSESAAAGSCIRAARSLRAAMAGVAQRSGLAAEALTMRFGLHWGATLYVGLISTVGRTETTALGDEVNDAARIEACATGGRVLASKPLVERLSSNGARELGLDLDAVTYTQLGDLTSATDKARRDAPSIAVCEL